MTTIGETCRQIIFQPSYRVSGQKRATNNVRAILLHALQRVAIGQAQGGFASLSSMKWLCCVTRFMKCFESTENPRCHYYACYSCVYCLPTRVFVLQGYPCRAGEKCQLTADDCKPGPGVECRDAPMPYCVRTCH